MNAPLRPGRQDGGSDGGTQTLKAVVLIAVVVLVGVLVLHHTPKAKTPSKSAGKSSQQTTTVGPTTTRPAPTTTTTLVPVTSIKLQVLNATGAGELATEWSRKLKADPGYVTQTPDNATARATTSAIYVITPGYLPEAYALAKTVGLPDSAVVTTIPAPASAPIPTAERATANLVLVIGPNLASTA